MRALGAHFSPRAMAAVIAANLAQDSLQNLLGHPEIHFDNCAFDAARARIATLRDRVAASSDPAQQWRAFGALTHTAQDFYSHSNYVALWVERHGGYERTRPDEIDGLDETLLSCPELRTAYFRFWWDVLYHLPGRGIFRRLVPPRPDSHEAMHLDGPERGPA
ncbi:MAG: hypothetical protein HY260_05920, partial [Chloroflexi bacterium]|nr:hypothetical protein [Chloroflexota bacterium]